MTLAAAVPFVPAAFQFVQRGIPDYLFTGDGATLELRVLHAAHGAQFLGPYSRFFWSHPGPTFFYLALPLYEAFHERGPALNLFMFLVNLVLAIALVLTARRLRGDAFAWLVAALLAIFELVALPFLQTSEWNPVAPILPLVLMSFLTARLALGGTAVLPVFALLASAIVQTHVAYVPEVAALSGVALAASLWRLSATRHLRLTLQRRDWLILASTAGVLIVCWMLPLYESATNRPGNLRQLVAFFTMPHAPEHSWKVVFTTVVEQLGVMPVAFARTLHIPVATSVPAVSGLAVLVEVAVLMGALAAAAVQHDATLGVFAAMTLVEIVAAVASVREIRGEVLSYLVLWVAVPGFMTAATTAAWLTRGAERGRGLAVVAAGALIALTFVRPEPFAPVMRDPDPAAEQLARDVARYIMAEHVDHPIVRIGSSDAWPTAAAVILHLRKQRIMIHVEPAWLFMFGQPFVPDGSPHPVLIVGDRSFDEEARRQPQLTRVAEAGGVSVYFEPAGFLGSHRLEPPILRSASGVERDPHIAVDGVIPADGTAWDSAASVVLTSVSSAIVVGVPRHEVAGLFVSVDGNDLYTVRCLGGPDRTWSLGARHAQEAAVGMRTWMMFDATLSECDAVEVKPASGDGLYSIGEIGFLRR